MAARRAAAPAPVPLHLEVNGDAVAVDVPTTAMLLDVIRERLGLVGAKRACNAGTCGACTVLVDGHAIYSCMRLAASCDGARVETIEGLATDRALHPVQEAFVEHDALQCGFCTPGQIMSVVGLLRATPRPTEEEVKRAVAGNLCRCGAYSNIVAAALSASKRSK